MPASTTAILDTFAAIELRRSVKHFDPNFTMPQAHRDEMLRLMLLSPTSFNIQNWRFVVVEDPALRAQIEAAAWGQKQMTQASMLVVLCADLLSWRQEPARYWANAPEAVRNTLVPMIGQFYKDNPGLQRDEAMRSCGIAAQTLMLAAKALGYDSCPMVGFDPVQVAQLIRLPENHVISMIVTVGKALQPAHPRGGQLPFEDVVVVNQFS